MKLHFLGLDGQRTFRQGKSALLGASAAVALLLAQSASAADSQGVPFNNSVRYSQWAIDSRLHDFRSNTKQFGFDYYDANGKETKHVTWYNNSSEYSRVFEYVAGLVGKATLEAADYYEGFDWSKPWFYSAQAYATGTPYSNSAMTLDNMNAAKMYFPILVGKLKSSDAETVAKRAISDVISDMKTYNTTYVIGGTKSGINETTANDMQKKMLGGWFHKSTDYTDQMWCDGQYMGPALLAQLIKHTGSTTNISDNDWDIVAKQFTISWEQLHDATTGLLYHGFTANPGDNASSSWSGVSLDKGVYHSASFWGRANAWYFLALIDVLEAMPTDNTHYSTLKGYLTELAAAIAKYQNSDTGCWYQVLDKGSALSGNYIESSCSSLFTAGYLKAIRLGLLDKSTYESVAKNAYEGLVDNFMVYDNADNSTIQLVKSCTSAGLGGNSNRAGDDSYYLTGTDAKKVTSADPSNTYYYTEGKVLGGFIMAATEYERAYQGQDSKRVLFAYDLAPEYDFSTTGGSLKAEAYGNGTVTYEWFKAKAKDSSTGTGVAGATSDTFAPTEDGYYFCSAKDENGATAQTRTTYVKANKSTTGGDDTPSTTQTLFSMSVNNDASLSVASNTTEKLTSGQVSLTGGTATLVNTRSTAWDAFSNGSIVASDKTKNYLKLNLNSALAAGDVITIADKAKTFYLTSTASRSTSIATANGEYTVGESSDLAGKSELYIWWNATSDGVTNITITRVGSSEPTTTQYTVTATANPTEGGTVAIKSGDNTIASGSEVDEKSTVTFTATPAEGYEFTGWTVNDAAVEDTETTYNVVSLAANTTVVANFKKGGTTVVTGMASFPLTDLKTLDSNPDETEKSSLTAGDITIKAGSTGIDGGYDKGFRMGHPSSFTIEATGNTKITKIEIVQDTKSRWLSFSPAGNESTADYTISHTYTDYPTSVTVSNATSGNICVSEIKVYYSTETVIEKTDFIATFTPATVTAVEGTDPVELPTLSVTNGKYPITPKYYTVGEYTSTDENVAKVANGKVVFVGKGTATIKTTVTPTADVANAFNGCEASFTVNVAEKTTPVDPTQPDFVYDFNTTVGATASYSKGVYADGTTKLVFGSDFKPAEGKYITITAKDNGGFKVGDIITLNGYCNSQNKSGIEVHSVAADASIFKTNTLAKYAEGGSEYTYTLTEGCDSLCFGRFGGGNVYLTSLQVTRPASSAEKTRLTASFDRNSDVVVNVSSTVTMPKLTVKAGDTELTNEQYNVVYTSNAESVAVVDGENINIQGEGTATILATVTPTDNENYEGCTATYQLTVKNPTELAISVQNVIVNVTDVAVKQPEILVYGDDDKLLKIGEDYTLEYEVSGDKNVSVDADGVFSVGGKAYAWTEGVTTVTVTATPTQSLGDTYKAGSLDFTYSVVKGKRTAVFMPSFNGTTIKFHKDTDKREITVPLFYNGQDVSDAFTYKYYNGETQLDLKQEQIDKETYVDTNTMLFTPSAEGTYTIRVTAEPKSGTADDGSDAYDQVYNVPDEIKFTIDVKDSYIIPVITLDPDEVYMSVGNTEGAPDVTVEDKSGNVLEDYYVAWTTWDSYYLRVSAATGKLEAVSEGTARVRCLVTGENLESATKFFNVVITDPAKYSVKKTGETYGNQHVMWNDAKTLAVKLGGWMFPNDVTNTSELYGTSGDGLKKSYVWNTNGSYTSWDINGFTYLVGSDKGSNARQENASNARPESTNLYNATYDVKGTIVDKMFNVPCSGSYLVFNPKTNGTVSVDIFQKGVFDKDTKNGKTVYQYRPQRRVFVMDEAGNVVNSKGVIGNANGKPKNLTMSDYKWDLNSDATPTIEEVKSHFKGLDNFEMSEEDFQNNIFRSNLNTDKIVNEAADAYPEKDGAWGWCVLSNAPVEYTFAVKAGKTYYLYNYGSRISFYGFSFEEAEKAPAVVELELSETATDNQQKIAENNGKLAKVSIDRNFTAGVWSTCVLPFSLNKPQVDAIFGETYSYDAKEGTQILYFDHVEGNKVWFTRHAYNTIVAGKPFLIKTTKNVTGINTADCAEYPYVTIDAAKAPADWCEGDGYVWKSSYDYGMTVNAGDGFIAKDGTFKTLTGDSGQLKGFRGYLKAKLENGAKPQVLSVGIGSNLESDGETTFINGLTMDSDGSIISTVAEDGKVYNVSGQVVGNDANALKSLPSGVYVINGKKYVK